MIDRLVSALALAATVSGCASIAQSEMKIDQVQRSADALRDLVDRNATNGGVIRTKGPRIAGEEIVLKSSTLPARFDEQVSYVTKGGQTLTQTLEDISISTGMAIRSTEVAGTQRPAGAEPLTGTVHLEYAGTLRGLLDEVASKGDACWRYNPASRLVEFFRFETRTINVNVPAGAKSISSAVSLAGVTGSSGGSGAGNVSVSQSLSIDPWTSLTDGVRSILAEGRTSQLLGAPGAAAVTAAAPAAGAAGRPMPGAMEGTVIANPELGLITVTAKPPVLERVARYVASINARFARNVLIDVKILSVSLNQEASAGFNVNLLYNSLGKLGASLNGPSALPAGSTSPGVLTLGPSDPSSPWNGSAIVASALSQYGKVSIQKQQQLLAVNGQPTPMQIANEISYVSGAKTTLASNVGAATEQTVSQKVVGFTANFTPLILGDHRILLSYQLQLSSLAAPLTPNAAGIVTPNIASQSLPGQAFMRDGESIVLFGSDEQRDAIDSATHLAGLSKATTKERQLMVIVVQVNTGQKDEKR